MPGASVHAVELDEPAHLWAERNLADTGVDLRLGDMATAFATWPARSTCSTCNPPYIPLDAWESVAAEARDHDPHLALFSGDDGLDAIRVLERRAAQLLRPGGVVGFEHADAQGESAPAVFAATGRWSEVRDHADLAGRAALHHGAAGTMSPVTSERLPDRDRGGAGGRGRGGVPRHRSGASWS